LGTRAPWWQTGVFYQVYPRSFADSNADGIGDLQGLIDRLNYLEWLGIDGLWLNPIMQSPNDDWGYDVSDYTSVDPDLGSLADVDRLIAEAGSRGISVLLDFVPNHTSSRHEWFKQSRSSRQSPHRDWYVWADPKPDGSPPNNWLSVFGGSAWEYDSGTDQFYLHNFLDSQADLNWWNDDVKRAMDEVLGFWWDRGVAGFRIDVAHAVVKDRELRDNLPTTADDDPKVQGLGQRQTYNTNQPEVHDVIRRWRAVADTYDPERILVGETFLLDLVEVAKYYGAGDELHMAFNFPFVFCRFEPRALKELVELTESLLDPDAWPVWTGSNHDVLRFPSRWCEGDERKIRLALMMLLTLRGTPFLYYGDEIGMLNVDLSYDEIKDPVGKRFWPDDKGRDAGRTPMQWSAESGAGFTDSGVRTWLPLGDMSRCNVADQRDDPKSILSFVRKLISVRRERQDLQLGCFTAYDSPGDVWAFRRGSGTVVALNFSNDASDVLDSSTVLLSTNPSADHSAAGVLQLSPWEGVILVAE
jgi:alpha-glucosidase